MVDRAVGARHAAVDFQCQRLNAFEIVGMADDQPARRSRQWGIIIDAILKSGMMLDAWIDAVGWRKVLSEFPSLPLGKLPTGVACYPGPISMRRMSSPAVATPTSVAFATPGVRIWTPGPDPFGEYQTGTSFAAPFATAAAAVALMTGVPAEPDTLKRTLAQHSRHLGAPGRNPIYGYGLLRATTSCDVATARLR
jgi:hypothetical protein